MVMDSEAVGTASHPRRCLPRMCCCCRWPSVAVGASAPSSSWPTTGQMMTNYGYRGCLSSSGDQNQLQLQIDRKLNRNNTVMGSCHTRHLDAVVGDVAVDATTLMTERRLLDNC